MLNRERKRRLDQFRIREESGSFYIEQKVHIKITNLLGKIKEKRSRWETIYDDCILYLDGEVIGFGKFKSKEQAKRGVKCYREERGLAKKPIKYHEV